jgi:hypothetical protein
MFDIVIPYTDKDKSTIHSCINSCYRFVKGFGKIFIVSKNNPNVPQTIWIDENQFFSKEDILNLNPKIPNQRVGWYLQQMIKLYVFEKIQVENEYCLILDSDVVFQTPIKFFSEENLPLYISSKEYHKPYFDIMPKLNPVFGRTVDSSGVAHMCLFKKTILKEIHDLIKEYTGMPLIEAVMKNIADSELNGSGISEYELYYHYIHKFHPNEFKVRNLRYKTIFNHNPRLSYATDCDYLADHSWGRK